MSKANNTKLLPLVLLFVLFWAPGAAVADDISDLESMRHADSLYLLSIDDVTRLALRNNFDIQLAKYDVFIARTDEGAAESIYDTMLTAEVKYQNDQSKQTSSLFGSKSLTNVYNLSLSKKLPTGTTVTVDSDNNRTWTDSSFASLNPSHDTALGVKVEQELGKNFFGLQDRGGVKLTRLDIENSNIISLDKIEDDILKVQTAYWDLVLQSERVRIEKEILEQAKDLFELQQEKIKDGLVELPDLLAAEANYQQHVNDLLIAQNDLKTKENVLRLQLNIEDEGQVLETADPFPSDSGERSVIPSMKLALDNRYDYQQAKNTIESKKINLSMKKNNLWPEVNLTASLAQNGVDDHFNQAFDGVIEEDNPNLFAGLTVSFPLENRKAKSQKKAAQLEKARAILDLKRVERTIAVEVHDQVRECNVFQKTATNQQEIAKLLVRKLEAEEKRYNRGRSDTDTMIRYQGEASQARFRAAQAQFDYAVSLTELKKVEGLLLKNYWDGEL